MTPTCRFCAAPLTERFADLGVMPLSNAYVPADRLWESESFHPLVAFVCTECFLVQVPAVRPPDEIFSDYPYFSSYSSGLLEHSRAYADEMRTALALGPTSQVVEIASNDGYLLQFFRDAGVPVLGIDPAANIGALARERGIDTITAFFGVEAAQQVAGRADLLIANNVLAHVPDINDFVEGLRIALAPAGTLTIEFPHLLRIIETVQFDTIYHEHYSYLSLLAVRRLLAARGLDVVRVDQVPTQGGSLRVHARHAGQAAADASVDAVLDDERAAGLDSVERYRRFADGIAACKRALLLFLLQARDEGRTVVGYGAPAKATILLNHCGVGTDLLEYTVDISPHKQGRYVPGARVPIHAPERIAETKPDYVIVFPWNIKDEIIEQMAHVRDWGGRFVIPVPLVDVLP